MQGVRASEREREMKARYVKRNEEMDRTDVMRFENVADVVSVSIPAVQLELPGAWMGLFDGYFLGINELILLSYKKEGNWSWVFLSLPWPFGCGQLVGRSPSFFVSLQFTEEWWITCGVWYEGVCV